MTQVRYMRMPGDEMATRTTRPRKIRSPHPHPIPSSTVEPVPLAGKLIEQPLPDTTGGYKPPTTVIDLIYRIWMSLEWRKTAQMVVVLFVAGLTVALVFAGLGLLVHALIWTPTVWSALGVGAIVSGSAPSRG